MDKGSVMRPRPFLISFLIGGLVFGVVCYMLRNDPCVETSDFHMEPNVVKPGEKFFAVWTAKTLRECNGELNRRFVDDNGIDVWVFPLSHIVENGSPGEVHRFHTPWVAPVAPPGRHIVLRKDIRRWGNWLQKWLPMRETQEAGFTMAE